MTMLEVTLPICRNHHRRRSLEKDVLRNFAKFTGKHLCQGLFFNKFFLQNTSRRLHLYLLITFHLGYLTARLDPLLCACVTGK